MKLHKALKAQQRKPIRLLSPRRTRLRWLAIQLCREPRWAGLRDVFGRAGREADYDNAAD